MSESSVKNMNLSPLRGPKGRRFARISLQLLIFTTLILGSLFILRPLGGALDKQMLLLRDRGLAYLEKLLNRRIEYSRIGPSLFGTLDIYGLQVFRTDGSLFASTERISLSYSLKDLISGKGLSSLSSIKVNNIILDIDLNADEDLLIPLNFSGTSSKDHMALLASLPAVDIQIRGGDLKIRDASGLLRFKSLSMNAVIGASQLELNAAWSLSASGFMVPPQLESITLNAKSSGTIDMTSGKGDWILDISKVDTSLFMLKNLSLLAHFDKAGLELRKVKDRYPYDAVFRYDTSQDSWFGELKLEGLEPGDLATLKGAWGQYLPWLYLGLSGYLSVQLPRNSAPTYQGYLELAFPSSLTIGPGTLQAKMHGISDVLYFDTLSYRGKRGNLDFNGTVALGEKSVDGDLRIVDIWMDRGGVLRGDFAIATEGQEYILFGENVQIGAVPLFALDGRIIPGEGLWDFTFSALRFLDLESYEDVRLTRIDVEGTFIPGEPLLQASLSFDSFSASDFLAIADLFISQESFPMELDHLARSVYLSTEVFITTDFTNLSINIPRLMASYTGESEFLLIASLSGTDKRVELDQGKLIWTGGSFDFSAYLDYADVSDLAFGISGSYGDIPYYVDGLYLDGRSLSLQGSYGLAANLNQNEGGGLSGFIITQGFPIPYSDQQAALSLSASMRWYDMNSWSLDVDSLDVEGISLPASPSVRIHLLQGRIDQNGGILHQVRYDDGKGILSGAAEFSWPRGFSQLSSTIYLAREAFSERYALDFSLDPRGSVATLTVQDGQVARFIKDAHSAQGTGTLSLQWLSKDSFTAQLNLASFYARFGERELNASGTGTLNEKAFLAREVRVNYGGIQLELPTGSIDLEKTAANFTARVRGAAMNMDMELGMDGSINFAPIKSWMETQEALTFMEGILKVNKLRMDSWNIEEPFDFTFQRNKSSFYLTGGPQGAIRLQLGEEGSIYAALSNPSPLRGSLTGSIQEGWIDAGIKDLYIDISDLWSLLPQDLSRDFAFTGGFINASLEISGPLGDPEFNGTAYANSIHVMVPQWVDTEIGPASFQIDIDGNRMSFQKDRIPAGPGMGSLIGSFVLEQWLPVSFLLDITIDEDKPVPFKTDILGIKSLGLAHGTLHFGLDDERFLIRGRLHPRNTLITLDTQDLAAEEQGADPYSQGNADIPMVLDMQLTSGRRVEFAWPTIDFPILRGYADVGSGVAILWDSRYGSFSMDGDINLRGGEVFYFQRSFYIREGTLRFNENEMNFDPRVVLRAELRDRNDEGPVTIALVVDEAPLSNFTPRLEATPALSQYEIISLLGQNISSQRDEEGAVSIQDAVIVASSDLLAQFNVIRVFERNVRDLLGLDMFSVRTQILQNTVLQATGLRPDPVDRIGGLGNYFDNTTVFFGKYLGSDLFLQSMLSLRYDENKAYDLFGGLTLEPELGVEMKTPLFNVRWNFLPSNPQNSFIEDHSFTLLWKWSF